ncbi:MAG TPA: ABC transporter ATP-binding protein [Syntrophales bacterium]|nr:ABC transporter ATP-binding protein [Syntrophales bacterium]
MTGSGHILSASDLLVERGGSVILDRVSCDIREGEVVSLIGPNGAGKTTLLMALSGLTRLNGGKVLFRGREVGKEIAGLPYRRKIAVVFQEPLLFNTTVFENIASGPKIRGSSSLEIRRTVSEQMERFGIPHLADRSARTLSGGEAQRTSLARAFATRPEILFLDEPFASLDPPSRDSLIRDLEGVLNQTKTTAVLATHDRTEALMMSDRIAVMLAGKIAQNGTPEEVMNRPADPDIAAFVGAETIVTGKILRRENGTFILSAGSSEIEAAGEGEPGELVILFVRPENVTLTRRATKEQSSARNMFPARIVRLIPAGFYFKAELECGFPLDAFITGRSVEEMGLKEGTEVFASFKATAIHSIRKK